MLEFLQSIITATTKHTLYIETKKIHEWSTSKVGSYGISDRWYINVKRDTFSLLSTSQATVLPSCCCNPPPGCHFASSNDQESKENNVPLR